MAEKETSTVDSIEKLLADFESRHSMRIWLAKKFGPRWEFVAGSRDIEGLNSWRFSIGFRYTLIMEAPLFPDQLSPDLTALGEELMKRINENGI